MQQTLSVNTCLYSYTSVYVLDVHVYMDTLRLVYAVYLVKVLLQLCHLVVAVHVVHAVAAQLLREERVREVVEQITTHERNQCH
jgi:hypothetical protein